MAENSEKKFAVDSFLRWNFQGNNQIIVMPPNCGLFPLTERNGYLKVPQTMTFLMEWRTLFNNKEQKQEPQSPFNGKDPHNAFTPPSRRGDEIGNLSPLDL